MTKKMTKKDALELLRFLLDQPELMDPLEGKSGKVKANATGETKEMIGKFISICKKYKTELGHWPDVHSQETFKRQFPEDCSLIEEVVSTTLEGIDKKFLTKIIIDWITAWQEVEYTSLKVDLIQRRNKADSDGDEREVSKCERELKNLAIKYKWWVESDQNNSEFTFTDADNWHLEFDKDEKRWALSPRFDLLNQILREPDGEEGFIAKGHILNVLVKTGGGKTRLLMNLAASFVEAGLRVCVVGTEQMKSEYLQLIMQPLLKIPTKEFRENKRRDGWLKTSFTTFAQKIQKFGMGDRRIYTDELFPNGIFGSIEEMQNNGHPIFAPEVISAGLDRKVGDVVKKIKDREEELGNYFDVVVLDYPALFKRTDEKTSSAESIHLDEKSIYNELKNHAIANSWILLMATQGNKESFRNSPSMANQAGSMTAAHISNIYLSAERIGPVSVLRVEKSRYSDSGSNLVLIYDRTTETLVPVEANINIKTLRDTVEVEGEDFIYRRGEYR